MVRKDRQKYRNDLFFFLSFFLSSFLSLFSFFSFFISFFFFFFLSFLSDSAHFCLCLVARYHSACARAEEAVIKQLLELAEKLQKHQLAIINLASFAVIGHTLYWHTK